MLVKCEANRGNKLSEHYLRTGYTPESVFHVSIGKSYRVFGISLWQSLLQLLIQDDDHLPNWYPSELFSVIDTQIPPDWHFTKDDLNIEGLQALWSYEAMIADTSHYDALLGRDSTAMEIFYREVMKTES